MPCLAVTIDKTSESDDLDVQVRQAENELLKAKATYSLRNQIIENVLLTDPILKAVHSGQQGTAAERYEVRRSDGHDTDDNVQHVVNSDQLPRCALHGAYQSFIESQIDLGLSTGGRDRESHRYEKEPGAG